MPDTILTRLRKAWNVFRYGEEFVYREDIGAGQGYRPDRIRFLSGNERSIIAALYNRIGVDVAAIGLKHIRTDENENFLEVINSGLNNCLTIEANIDQPGRAFIQDVAMCMCDEGCVAIVPVDTTIDPSVSSSYDVLTMRTGKILQWFPEHVRVNLYNQMTGNRQDITLPKTMVAIVENPLYAVMNEPNSTLKRLIEKINLLDVIDNQSGSGKLDLIVQLPYVIKTPLRKTQAETRRADLEAQLKDSKYGIAYIDGTEKVIQLNRPAENNLMAQIEFLTSMLYSQLGVTKEVLEGTADEKTMLNYYSRTIEPFLGAIADSMERVFLTKTARSQFQTISYIRNPFKLVPSSGLAELADKFTRNEILTSNEFRGIIGFKPSSDPKANELRNKNLNQNIDAPNTSVEEESIETNQNGRS